jgi:hypothetical protein
MVSTRGVKAGDKVLQAAPPWVHRALTIVVYGGAAIIIAALLVAVYLARSRN